MELVYKIYEAKTISDIKNLVNTTDINQIRCERGFNLLSLCIQSVAEKSDNLIEIIKYLLDNKVDVNSQSQIGLTAMMLISSFYYDDEYVEYKNLFIDIANLLIAAKCDLNLQNEDGDTALHMCSSYAGKESLEIAKIIVKAGACIDIQNYKGWTPLMTACSWNEIKVIKFLVDSGADIKISDHDRCRADDICTSEEVKKYFTVLKYSRKNAIRITNKDNKIKQITEILADSKSCDDYEVSQKIYNLFRE